METLAKDIFKKIKDVLKNENIDDFTAFKSIDLDRDKKIGLSDMQKAFTLMNLKYSTEQVKSMIQFLDKDEDGYLSFQEFQYALNNL